LPIIAIGEDYTGLIIHNGFAYAYGYGGLAVVNVQKAELAYRIWGGGSAGYIYNLHILNNIMYQGREFGVAIYDVSNPYSIEFLKSIDTPEPCWDMDVRNNLLTTLWFTYDVSDPINPRCVNPGATIAIYDNKGTWVMESINSGWGPKTIGFGWSGTEPIIGDWDADGFNEVGVYNRAGNNFLTRNDDESYKTIGLGWSGVSPVVGDFDGDGDDNIGVFDNKGTWALSTNSGFKIVGFGWAGAEPIVGDWDGDGDDDVGIYNRPGNNFLIPKDSSYYIVGLGWEGIIPIVGDWDGDEHDEVGVYDPETSAFALAGKTPFTFGVTNSKPIVGDVNKDGVDEVGTCSPAGIFKYNVDGYYPIETQCWKGTTIHSN
jgi:hypothetical protein